MAETVAPGLERRLRTELTGEVMFDRFTRGRYATDASHYQMMPVGVVAPRTIDEANRAIAIAREEGVSVTPRGGGTSQAGQTINSTLIIDCSKYLDRVLEIDAAGRRCLVEPGIVLDELNRKLKPHGLWFPVDISTASRATIGGMVGNNSCGARSLRYGNTRENVLSIDALLADGRAAHFGPVSSDLSDIAADSPLKPLARTLLALVRAKRTPSRPAFRKSSAASVATTSTRSRPDATISISLISWSARKARLVSRPGSS
jgi:FAD/FMN-containing dehydrogenase